MNMKLRENGSFLGFIVSDILTEHVLTLSLENTF